MKTKSAKLAKRSWIAHIDDERDIGNSIIVTLEEDWIFNDGQGAGVCGFNTIAEMMAGTTKSCITTRRAFPGVQREIKMNQLKTNSEV
jgi:hypothetical protein